MSERDTNHNQNNGQGRGGRGGGRRGRGGRGGRNNNRAGGRGGGRGNDNSNIINNNNTSNTRQSSHSSSRGQGFGSRTESEGKQGRGGGRGQGQRGRGGGRTNAHQTFKRNGEKGAEVHTVSEEVRIRFTKLMLDLRENENVDKIEMPTDLTNTERKFLHQLASQLGLISKSTGKGEERRIIVRKMNNTGQGKDKNDNDSDVPMLKMGQKAVSELATYVTDFPPNHIERAEATETGSSLWNASKLKDKSTHNNNGIGEQESNVDVDDDAGDDILLETLDQLKIHTDYDNRERTKQYKRIDLKRRVALHHASQKAKHHNPNYKQMIKMRSKLPSFNYEKEICSVINSNRVTILSGDTGCGKSTQVPQFLLDDKTIGPSCNIVVTQPRRISAISIAERVASERCEQVGGSVGYNVRLESSTSNSTQLLFLTPGVLLRKFQSDAELNEFTHVIIDEIHERDKYTEFLMIALRELMNRRDDLRVVLMSATIQTNELLEYWSSAGSDYEIDLNVSDAEHRAAEINIPGRTYPVQEFFLEDVLKMTGFVNEIGGELDDIESSMSALFDQNLTCIMCNKSGFKCAEELGTHVAICDGGSSLNPLQLEKKVRNANTSLKSHYNDTRRENELNDAGGTIFEHYDENSEPQDKDSYEDEEDLGLMMTKWDGESPFAAQDNVDSGTMTTLTDEEMLNRYQACHDDEEIDDDLVLEVLKYINKSSYGDGAVLIFLPGWQEISELTLLLDNTPPFSDKSKFSVLPLHSGIPSKEQRLVFQRPKKGIRKIILSTNIAETSVTIDDVAFVVDSGRAKEKNYDPHLKMSTLQPVWISQASAKQRKGRAGRTKAGVCFHLFSQRRHASFREFLESELLRTSLEEMALQCKKLQLAPGGPEDDDGIPAFLASALTPPHPISVQNALESLVEMGAMDGETNDLTKLGHCLSVLSLEPRVGKMLIWSYILGCSKEATSMAVASSYKSPFILPPPSMRYDADEAKIELSRGTESDQVTVLNVLKVRDDMYRKGRQNQFYNYCRRNFINTPTINMIADLRRNIARELITIGFDDPHSKNWHNRNSVEMNLPFLQATIAAGIYPNLASREEGQSNFKTLGNRKAKIHLSSVNACKGQPLSRKSQILEYVAYGELVKGVSSYTLSLTTHIASLMPILLTAKEFRIRPLHLDGDQTRESLITVDDIKCRCENESAFGLTVLRNRCMAIFERVVSNPNLTIDGLDHADWKALRTLDVVIRSAFQSSPGRL